MSLDKSSTNIRRYLLPPSVADELGPQISPLTSSKVLLALYEVIEGNGLLYCSVVMGS